MNKKPYLVIIFILSFILLLGMPNKAVNKKLPVLNSIEWPPVVFHDSNSNLPDTIEVKGTIVAISPGICGNICLGGVIKVKLDLKIKNYNDTFAYIVTACLSFRVNLDAKVNVISSKLFRGEKECYYRSINNSIDSKGTPFYKLSEMETSKIK